MDEEVFVLDTSGFLAKWQLYAPRSKIYTTSLVLAEVRDSENREALELALSLDRVKVIEPAPSYVKKVLKEAQRLGLHTTLSKTDISVAALALQLAKEGYTVEVITDDYALQNLLSFLGIRFRPLRTRGIKRREEYIVICPACGYRSNNPGEHICPICGTPLKRVRRYKTRTRRRK